MDEMNEKSYSHGNGIPFHHGNNLKFFRENMVYGISKMNVTNIFVTFFTQKRRTNKKKKNKQLSL